MFLDAATHATTDDAPARPSAFARVEVHFDAAPVADLWTDLEGRATATIYQTRAFLTAWAAHLGAARRLQPLYIVARDAADRAVLLLPLAIAHSGPVRWAGYLGGRDSNLNLPLLAPGSRWSAADIRRLLRAAAATARIDLYVLQNQPARWRMQETPLLLLPHQPSASAAHGTDLGASAPDLFEAKLSKEARKKLRKKEAALGKQGTLTHLIAATEAERRAVLDAFIAQKCARFAAKGIASAFGSPAMRGFLDQASREGAIELHALGLEGRVIAVYGGGARDGHWSGMFNSFAADPDIARASPGEILLTRLVTDLHRRGLTSMDLGIGEARYKAALCDTPIPLFDSVIPVTGRGQAAAVLVRSALAAKRRLKTHPGLHALTRRAVSARFGGA